MTIYRNLIFLVSFALAMLVFTPSVFAAVLSKTYSWAIQAKDAQINPIEFGISYPAPILELKPDEAYKLKQDQSYILAEQVCHLNYPLADSCEIEQVTSQDREDFNTLKTGSYELTDFPISRTLYFMYSLEAKIKSKGPSTLFIHTKVTELDFDETCPSKALSETEKKKVCNSYCNDSCDFGYSSVFDNQKLEKFDLHIPIQWTASFSKAEGNFNRCVSLSKFYCKNPKN